MKNSNRLMLLGSAAALMLAVAAPVFADMGGPNMGIWPDADTNKDGSIDRAEFDIERTAHFKTVDANSDGFITEDEMKTFRDAMHAKMEGKQGDMGAKFLKRFDANADGKVTEAEWPKKGRMTFAEADANKDGAVMADELAKMRAPHDGKQKDGKDGLARLDTDKDGKVSLAEWSALGDKMFARMDDNGDGKIVKDEMPKHHMGDGPQDDNTPVLP